MTRGELELLTDIRDFTTHTSRPVRAGMGVLGLILPKMAPKNTVFYGKLAKAVRNYPSLYDKSRLT